MMCKMTRCPHLSKARQVYLNIVRKKVKTRNAIRVGIGKQLRLIRRNLIIIMTNFASGCYLSLKQFKLYETICKIYDQQTEMCINRKHKVVEHIVKGCRILTFLCNFGTLVIARNEVTKQSRKT